MIHLKNFTQYSPESDEEKEIAANFNAIFLKAESGEDWYKTIHKFEPDTFKIKYDKTGTVISICKDASAICPIDGSIIEVSDIPDGLEANGSWVFIDGEFKQREKSKDELIAQADAKKSSLLSSISEITKPLEDAVELDMATPDEVKALKEWKVYRVKLSRVETALAPNIDWPQSPNDQRVQ